MPETELQQGQAFVESRFREELSEQGLGEPSFEWGPEDDQILYPVRVTLEGIAHVYRFPRVPLEDRDQRIRLSRLVREFVEDIGRGAGR